MKTAALPPVRLALAVLTEEPITLITVQADATNAANAATTANVQIAVG
jgi:hypothetical protein